MLGAIIPTFLAVLSISLLGLMALLTFTRMKSIDTSMHAFISFASGTMLGAAFFALLPELFSEKINAGLVLFLGFLFFFLIEKFLHWHNCGEDNLEECDHHDHSHDSVKKAPAGMLALAGHITHSIVDGTLIAATFLTNIAAGISIALAIAAHSIPNLLGTYAIFLHSGYSKAKALIYNSIGAFAVLIGGIIGYFAFESVSSLLPYAVGIATGGFIYVATVDLLPETSRTENRRVLVENIIFFLVGVGVMVGIKAVFGQL